MGYTPFVQNLARLSLLQNIFTIKREHIRFEGTEEELDRELPEWLRDLRRVKGRDLDPERERRLPSGGLAVVRYGAGE